ELSAKIAEQIEIDAKYDVYLSRQAADIAAYRRDESLELPAALDYAELRGLSNEVRHKLQTLRPRTIGQAGRIDGITPAALTLLVAHLKRKARGGKSVSIARGWAQGQGLCCRPRASGGPFSRVGGYGSPLPRGRQAELDLRGSRSLSRSRARAFAVRCFT